MIKFLKNPIIAAIIGFLTGILLEAVIPYYFHKLVEPSYEKQRVLDLNKALFTDLIIFNKDVLTTFVLFEKFYQMKNKPLLNIQSKDDFENELKNLLDAYHIPNTIDSQEKLLEEIKIHINKVQKHIDSLKTKYSNIYFLDNAYLTKYKNLKMIISNDKNIASFFEMHYIGHSAILMLHNKKDLKKVSLKEYQKLDSDNTSEKTDKLFNGFLKYKKAYLNTLLHLFDDIKKDINQ